MPICRWVCCGKEGEEETMVDKGRRRVAFLIEGYPLPKITASTGVSSLRPGPGKSLLWHRKNGPEMLDCVLMAMGWSWVRKVASGAHFLM